MKLRRRRSEDHHQSYTLLYYSHTCETILRFYSYDGTTNYVKCKTGGLQGDPPEFMVFCLVTLGDVFLRGSLRRISQDLSLVSELKSGFKLHDNLDFNLGKTMFLTKDTTTCMIGIIFFCRMTQVFRTLHMTLLWICSPSRESKYLDSNRHSHLHQGICGTELCQDSKECGEVWSSHLTDGFVQFHLVKFCMNTCT